MKCFSINNRKNSKKLWNKFKFENIALNINK